MDRAGSLSRDQMCRPAYRRVWERRLETAQYWDSGNLRRVGERVRGLVGLLRECEVEAGGVGRAVREGKEEVWARGNWGWLWMRDGLDG